MYMRFVSPLRSERRGVDLGIFQWAFECRNETETPASLREAIQLEVDWFNENLPVPRGRVFLAKSRKIMRSDGICWFRCEADTMIRRAFILRSLLGECGYVIVTRTTEVPGQILYKDDFQIVAKPKETTPTLWG